VLFKVITAAKTGAIVKQADPGGKLKIRTVFIPAGTILDVYGFAHDKETRLVVCNKQISKTLFTVSVNDCEPLQ